MSFRRDIGAGALLAQQFALGIALLLFWEVAGRWTDSIWISRPTDILMRLVGWASDNLHLHIATTLMEVVAGLAIGCSLGAVSGLLLGRSPVLGGILRPVIVAFYSIPLIALAPLFIMFLGIDLLPKIVLISIVTFFLMFFNTFSGAASIDKDLLVSCQLMGASRFEQFQKVVLPASMVWVVSGFKTCLPYSLVAATTGEMLAAKQGIGLLITRSASQLDITGIYAALLILLILGLVITELAESLDRWLLRWRVSSKG